MAEICAIAALAVETLKRRSQFWVVPGFVYTMCEIVLQCKELILLLSAGDISRLDNPYVQYVVFEVHDPEILILRGRLQYVNLGTY